MQKQKLRRDMRSTRKIWVSNLDTTQLQYCFSKTPSMVSVQLCNHNCIGGYSATGDEADPRQILQQMSGAGKQIALPYLAHRNAAMEFRRYYPGDTLEKGPFGMAQPPESAAISAPDAILCPLVAFTRNGTRLGQGGGHYDRYFAQNPHAIRMGLAWSVQETEIIPTDNFDIPMHAILTEREWIETGVKHYD